MTAVPEYEPSITAYDVEQGSDEWHALRRGVITASVIGKLITPTLKVANNETSRAITAQLVAERITGITEPTFVTDDMFRGIESEPIARDLYSGHYEQAVEVGFIKLETPTWSLGVSPDGLVGDVGGLEIKAPRQRGHILTILADEVPAQYVAQCQAALLVTGRRWWDYCSYHAGLPLFVKRIYPDPEWFSAIEAACVEFETNARHMLADYDAKTSRMPATKRIEPTEIRI